MVDTVRNSPQVGSTLFRTKESRAYHKWIRRTLQRQKASSITQSVSVDLSVSEKVKSLSSEPPVNIEVVNEIRQRVSEGRYPIDLNAITNKLFESIKEGEG